MSIRHSGMRDTVEIQFTLDDSVEFSKVKWLEKSQRRILA